MQERYLLTFFNENEVLQTRLVRYEWCLTNFRIHKLLRARMRLKMPVLWIVSTGREVWRNKSFAIKKGDGPKRLPL